MPKDPIASYWMEHYLRDGLCTLCGNSGILDTRHVRSPAGYYCGAVNWCFCPNGIEQRKRGNVVQGSRSDPEFALVAHQNDVNFRISGGRR